MKHGSSVDVVAGALCNMKTELKIRK